MLALALAGGFALCAAAGNSRQSGAVRAFSRGLSPVLNRLFPLLKPDSQARRAIAENFAANMLGLGNAATPAGLRAMRALREEEGAGCRRRTRCACFWC